MFGIEPENHLADKYLCRGDFEWLLSLIHPLGANDNYVENGLWRTISSSFWHSYWKKYKTMDSSTQKCLSHTWKLGANLSQFKGTCSIYLLFVSPWKNYQNPKKWTVEKGGPQFGNSKKLSWAFQGDLWALVPLRYYWIFLFPTRSKSPRGHRLPSYPQHLAVTQWWCGQGFFFGAQKRHEYFHFQG